MQKIKELFKSRCRKPGAVRNSVRTVYRLFSGFYIGVWRERRRLLKYGPAILDQTCKICEKVGIKPFLIQGTLLGYYRDKGFIRHDYDIDLGLKEEDAFKIDHLREEMLRAGYKVRQTLLLTGALSAFGQRSFISFMEPRSKIWVDFYLFNLYEGQWVHFQTGRSKNEFAEDIPKNEWMFAPGCIGQAWVYPPEILSHLSRVRFAGCDVFVPAMIEEYLQLTYGDWRMPTTDVSYPNVRLVISEPDGKSFKLTPVSRGKGS